MAEFQELIKNFERIRDYMRSFYVYGFKVRGDYDEKSARTYDNERRRIESWMAGYMKSSHTAKGKQVYINVDSRTVSENPLYAAWKAKSFTDNDIMLHFFLMDQLWERADGMSARELGDRMAEEYGVAFEGQTIRLKLREYEELGILRSEKRGKALFYQIAGGEDDFWQAEKWGEGGEENPLLTAVKFFQGEAPFGFVGSTLLDRVGAKNELFQFKHHFIVHTLEDGVLLAVVEAMEEHRRIFFANKSVRSGLTSAMEGIPLKIFVSTRTGRRYACCYQEGRRRFVNYRLDCMADVEKGSVFPEYDEKAALLSRNLERCWGVSFGGPGRLEEICVKLFVDEKREPHILNRLYREGRGGEIMKVRENEYLYSGAFFDTNEILSWLKTFTGRILDIQGSSQIAVMKVTRDWERMYEMYCKERGENAGEGKYERAREAERAAGKTEIAMERAEKGLERTEKGAERAEKGPERKERAPEREERASERMERTSERAKRAPGKTELFDKVYGQYYQVVGRILREAGRRPLTEKEMEAIVRSYGFEESALVILPKLLKGDWALLKRAGKREGRDVWISAVRHVPRLPLTLLQKRWLKALAADPRMDLFLNEEDRKRLETALEEYEPLYRQSYFHYFDRYRDGDDYGSPEYQENFRTILAAIEGRRALLVAYEGRTRSTCEVLPYQIQYSSKDDKFRLCCLKLSRGSFCRETVLNAARIKACHLSQRRLCPKELPCDWEACRFQNRGRAKEPVVIAISGERNSLERAMLHFASYEKHTEYEEEGRRYLCSIYYDVSDETELLVEILSFGPVLRVLGPAHFLEQVRQRVERQHELFYGRVE